jgi:hypothetical protein
MKRLAQAIYCLVLGVTLSTHASGQSRDQPPLTPTFDCAKVTAPLPVLICSDQDAATGDWELSSAFWPLYYLSSSGAQSSFNRAQDDFFNGLANSCGLPDATTTEPFHPSSSQIGCVANAYHKRANSYRGRLTGDALVEATLSPEQHKQVQEALISLGFLSGTADGLFGRQTRTAIRAFQSASDFQSTGFLAESERQSLFQQSGRLQPQKATDESRNQPRPEPNSPTAESASRSSSATPSASRLDAISAPTGIIARLSPPARFDQDGNAKCSGASTLEALAACDQILTLKNLSLDDFKLHLLKRAASKEGLKDTHGAYSDYSSVLLIDPDNVDAKEGRDRNATRTAMSSPAASIETGGSDRSQPDASGFRILSIIVASIAGACLLALMSFWPGLMTKAIQHGPRLARRIGAFCGLAVLSLALLDLGYGGSQSALVVGSAGHYVPSTAQAYVAIPHLGSFLASVTKYLEGTAAAIDNDRLARGLGANSADVGALLERLRSSTDIPFRNENVTVPTSCLDTARLEDQALVGIRSDTSAAAFIGNKTKPGDNAGALPILIMGPVERSPLAAYLSNSASQFLVDIHPAGDAQQNSPPDLTIEEWRSADFRLCGFMNGTKLISPFRAIAVTNRSKHTLFKLDPIGPLSENSSFSLRCFYSSNGNKTPCECELLERLDSGDLNSLGDCSADTKRRERFSKKHALQQLIEHGGPIPDTTSFSFPLLGRLGASNELGIRWKDDNTIAVGVESDLKQFLDRTSSGSAVSIIEDDSFVNRYREMAQQLTGFIGVVRPDFQSGQTFFSKIITLPMIISGTVSPNHLMLSASISFEPLDARILQDISRDFSPAEGSLPIRTSAGSASIRIGDNRVKQYVSFADAFILNRLIGGLSSLDTRSPSSALRANFARYFLFKVGIDDDSAPRPNRSLAEQPLQVVLLDDAEQAITPSTAIAVRFESVKAAQSFLCAEPSDVQRLVDKRTLLNAIRTAKAETDAVDDPDEYRESLKTALNSLLGEKTWAQYLRTYEIDPLLATIEDAESATSAIGTDNCEADVTGVSIGGKSRDIHYLSPPTTDAIQAFYYRMPDIVNEQNERLSALDKELATLSAEFANLPTQEADCGIALNLLGRASRDLPGLAEDAPPPEFLARLRLATEQAKVEFAFNNWETVKEAKDNLLDGGLEGALRSTAVGFAASRAALIDKIVDNRVRLSVALRRPNLVAKRLGGDNSRMVAFIDQEHRMLYIGSDLDALKRGAEQASATKPDNPSARAERIRLYASGDNTVQTILDLWPDETQTAQADRWRAAKQEGSLLPFGIGFVGISGRNNGVLISARIIREFAEEAGR